MDIFPAGGNGGAGLAYYHETDFVLSSATIVLEPKSHFKMDKLIGIYVALELSKYKKKYSRGFQWNLVRIKSDYIELPILETGEIDYQIIYQMYNL